MNKFQQWDRLLTCEAPTVDLGDAQRRYAACLRSDPDPAAYPAPSGTGSSNLGKRVGGVERTTEQWRELLPVTAFMVLRLKGTEPGAKLRFPLGFDDFAED